MARWTRHLGAVVATATALYATGCLEGAAAVMSPEQAELLSEVAEQVPAATLVEGLGLEGDARHQVVAHIDSLHAAMHRLHAVHPSDPDALSDEEATALHDDLQAATREVHHRQLLLVESLSDEQRHRLHQIVAEHHEEHEGAHLQAHDPTRHEAHSDHSDEDGAAHQTHPSHHPGGVPAPIPGS